MKYLELKEKWWFRLIKVIYIISIIIIFVIWLQLIKSDIIPEINKEKTNIICPNIDKDPLFLSIEKHITYKASDFDFNLSSYSFSWKKLMYDTLMSWYSDIPNKILVKCFKDKKNLIFKWLKLNLETIDDNKLYIIQDILNKIIKPHDKNIDEFDTDDLLLYTYLNSKNDYSPIYTNISYENKLFDIIPVYSYIKMITTFLFYIITIFIFIIITRWIFYYIIIWEFFPKVK